MVTVRYSKSRPYQISPGSAVPAPVLRVRLSHAGTQTPEILALLDSGADMSMFHADLATFLGIDLSACTATVSRGVGGEAHTYICDIQLEVERSSFRASVMFSNEVPSTLALLGRDNVFEKFRFGFDQRSGRVLFERY